MQDDLWSALPADITSLLERAGVVSMPTLCSMTRAEITAVLGEEGSYRTLRMKAREIGVRLRPEELSAAEAHVIDTFGPMYEAGTPLAEIAEAQGYSRSTADNREREYHRARAHQRRIDSWKQHMDQWPQQPILGA